MTARRLGGDLVATWLLVLSCVACQGSAQGTGLAGGPQQPKEDRAISYLDINRPSLTQPVLEADRADQAKFVELHVVEVQNPNRLPVSIQVAYLPKDGQPQILGSVSPFPADNPGKFLVATQGVVRTGGSLVLKVVLPDDLKSTGGWKLGLRRATFTR